MYKALDTFHNFIAELKRAVQFAVYGQERLSTDFRMS